MKLVEPLNGMIATVNDELSREIDRLEGEDSEFNNIDAIDALMMISDLKRNIRECEERINSMLTAWMLNNGEKQIEYCGMVAERKKSSTRKNWQHDTLLQAVINTSLNDEDRRIVDPETGEYIDLLVVAKPLIDHVVKNIQATAAIREWRVTALRSIVPGLNPDDFCEVESVEKVSIRKK